MNLAIVIGVSEYDRLEQLSACKNDSYIMNELLKKSNKYDDILYISDNTYARIIKTKIIEFINEHKNGEKIEEVFFYFSGHGGFGENEFHYICSDYDKKKLSATTLKNSELDSILKTIGAKLAIKVIDACNSGTRYVKGDIDEIKLKNTMKENYNDCYFMFSSAQEQSSMADDKISYFTESFIRAIVNFEGQSIRYRDIMDYISDEFSERNIEQQPFYVTQSSNMEYFIDINEEIKKNLSDMLNNLENHSEEEKKEKNKYDILKLDSKKYCNKFDEILDVFKQIENEFRNFKLDKSIENIYDVECITAKEQYNGLPDIDKVAKDIDKSSKEFLVDIYYEQKEIKNSLLSMFGNTKYEKIPFGYEIAEKKIEYNTIIIKIKSKLPNVKSARGIIIFAFSRKYINLYYHCQFYREKEFGTYVIEDDVNWKKSECEIKDTEQLLLNINMIKDNINKDILDYINNMINTIK